MLLPEIRLSGSMLLPVIRLAGSMLLLGNKPKFLNPFAECKFEKFDSPGGAYSRGVDSLEVCSSWRVNSLGGAYSRE